MSHAKHEWAAEMAKRVRRQAEARGVHIAVLFDLTGPSIRTGDLETPYTLLEGDIVEFRKTGTEPTVPLSTTVNYDGLMGDVTVGNTLVVDNGALLMRIDAVEADRILCYVKTPGTMGSRRHINLPGVRLNLPALTEKDHKDLVARRRVRRRLHRRLLRPRLPPTSANCAKRCKLSKARRRSSPRSRTRKPSATSTPSSTRPMSS